VGNLGAPPQVRVLGTALRGKTGAVLHMAKKPRKKIITLNFCATQEWPGDEKESSRDEIKGK